MELVIKKLKYMRYLVKTPINSFVCFSHIVKSVSPNKEVTEVEEAPPSLPPRQSSPIKSPSRPPIASPEATDISITTSSPKPTLPSRASKPSAAGTTTITTAASSKSSHSPVKEAVAKLNNNRALPQVPANKAPPPPPPLLASEKVLYHINFHYCKKKKDLYK